VHIVAHSMGKIPTTLYASSNDEAIRISKEPHSYPRAGEAGDDIIILPGLDTIDASMVDTSLIGHSYFAEKRSVLSDLFYLLGEGKPPSQRHSLEPRTSAKGTYRALELNEAISSSRARVTTAPPKPGL